MSQIRMLIFQLDESMKLSSSDSPTKRLAVYYRISSHTLRMMTDIPGLADLNQGDLNQ